VEGNLESLPTSEGAPELVNIIEMPVGNWDKYEYGPGTEAIMLDRMLPGGVRHLADYGFVSSTVSTDGKPLDVMVATCDHVFPMRVIDTLEIVTKEDAELNVFNGRYTH
jgi:inorganic pyrophosphatase